MAPIKPRKIVNRPHKEKVDAPRKVRFKLINYGDPNTPVASDISAIDDEANEKETLKPEPTKRKSVLLNTSVDSPIKSALANFTTAERESHFDFCMKLSMQNKITTKNAFSLHLIDVFSDNVEQGGDPNFQMASLTLDASARIYGFRVDCLHAETLKMATGLHSDRMRKTDEDGESKVDGDTDDGRKVERMKKKKRKKRFLDPSAAKSLQLVNLETEDEPHENFGIIKGVFSEAKCGGLLNTRNVISDDLKIPFVEAEPYFRTKEKFSIAENDNRIPINTAMRMLSPFINSTTDIASDTDGDLPIASSLESFSFLKKKWLHDQSFSGLALDETAEALEDSEADVSQSDEIVSPNDKVLSDLFGNYDSVGVDKQVLDPDLCSIFKNALRIENEGGCDDMNNDSMPSSPVFLVPQTPPPRKSCFLPKLVEPGSTVKSFQNSYMHPPLPHPQGTFETLIGPLFRMGIDPVVDAALTGRCQGRMKKVVQHISKGKAGHIKRPPRSRFITFEKDYDMFKKKVIQGKRNKFTDKYMNKWLPSDTLLPSVSFVNSDFRKTFIMPMNKVSECEQSLNDSGNGDGAEIMEHVELNRSFGYDHVHVPTADDCDNLNQPYKAEELDYIISSLDDLVLVPKPEMVKKDKVHYARYSKNVDQKRVKATIWNIITSHYHLKTEQNLESGQDQSVQFEDKSTHTPVAEHRPLKFSVMYRRLLQALPPGIKNKMSIQIGFVSILHLANEKNLDLEQKENENDFSIFVEQIANTE